jgi:YARHG domain
MKKLSFVFCIGIGLVACKPSTNPPADANVSSPNASSTTPSAPVPSPAKVDLSNIKLDARAVGAPKSQEQIELEEAHQKIIADANNPKSGLGFYTGAFGTNKITLIIESIEGGKISGHSVCAGNYRTLTGTYEQIENNMYKCVLNEPGTDKYDGKFEVEINPQTGKLIGKWAPFKAGVVPAKTFELSEQSPQVNLTAGLDWSSEPTAADISRRTSTVILQEDDLFELGTEMLKMLRNEIYARHGYCFKDKNIRAMFEKTSWYMPKSVDVRDDLSDIEVKNIDLIAQYEKYLVENADSFGR